MANIFEKIFHFEKRELNRYAREADRVIAYEEEIRKLSDDELRAKTKFFQEQLREGKVTLEDIKYEAFAVAREGATRTLHPHPSPDAL